MFRLIREGKCVRTGFNLEACKFFDFLNQKLRWNGQHAKNDKEKSVDVFLLDFYEHSQNVAIEWDEKHHKKAQHKKKDGFKQRLIMKSIGCEFYRIDDVTKTVRKVDKIPNDYTFKIQSTLNEYYERNK
jgi:very-short-patch-repair endonuclease